MVIRTLLWVGSAKGLAASGLPESPRFDVIWERSVDGAASLSLAALDGAVIEAAGELDAPAATAALTRHRPGLPVLLHDGSPEPLREWLDALCSGTRAADPPPPIEGLVGHSAAIDRVRWLAARAARSEVGVLVQGETGTGKELVARAIHRGGARRRGPFVAVNCAAFPDTLLESELLGHERGAFSGAERDRKGLIEAASGGTLLLDEVAETSPAFQAKLLRVLQERRVRPLGANRERPVDVRVVAATHRELRREVAAGRFREDLYYRLAVLPLRVPPLRERPGDLPLLARHFLERHARRAPKAEPAPRLDPELMAWLQAHRWPGNVRELENEIQHAIAIAEPGEPLARRHFSERIGAAVAPLDALAAQPQHAHEPLRETVARVEAQLIRRALSRHGGRRSETAAHLGLTREGLYKKMKRLGIE